MATPYWEHRAALRQAAYDRANNRVVQSVSRVYDRTMAQLDEDIKAIIGTYQRKTGLTVREAWEYLREGVPEGVLDDLRGRMAVVADPRERRRLQALLHTDRYRGRISRLDAMKASARIGLTEAAEAELQAITPHLRSIGGLAYSRTLFDIQKATAGFHGVGVPSRALDTILKTNWAGRHYSRAVWANRDAMAGMLDRAMMEMAGMGKLSDLTMKDVRGLVNLDKWRAQATTKFKNEAQYAKYAANRLVRTESAYVANQVTAIAYSEAGIEEYEYLATLDNRTSRICAELDGKRFKVSEKEVGVNYPPLHPHCRSSTAPYIDGLVREGLQRRGRDADGNSVLLPRDMNYAEWKRWQDAGCPDLGKWRTGNAPKLDIKPIAKADPLRPAILAGVEPGAPVSMKDAEGIRINPKFRSGDIGYQTNCQSCVVAHEAQIRGYNVEVLPNRPGSKGSDLAFGGQARFAWIDPNTGKAPDYIKPTDATNPAKLMQFLKDNVEEGGRYTFGHLWGGKNTSGHILSMYKENGEIVLFDPQAGNKPNVAQYLKKIRYSKVLGGQKIYTPPSLLRVDDKLFNMEIADGIMKGAGT